MAIARFPDTRKLCILRQNTKEKKCRTYLTSSKRPLNSTNQSLCYTKSKYNRFHLFPSSHSFLLHFLPAFVIFSFRFCFALMGGATMASTVNLSPTVILPSSSWVTLQQFAVSARSAGVRGSSISISGTKLAKTAINSSKYLKTQIVRCVGVEDGSATTTDTAVEDDIPIEKKYPAFPAVLDINQIRDILPHRFPFLLVDRVVEYKSGESAVAIKNVTINDNFFPGHFPERPIMPGVLMVEAMAQVGGLVMLQPEEGGSRENFFFAGVDKVRFRKPVIAGDTLVMRMNLVKLQKRFGIAKMEGKAYVGGEVVCEGEFMMAIGNS